MTRAACDGTNDLLYEGIPASDWVWCGFAGHFVGADSCGMHLNTRVGDYRISTVGDYRPPSHTGEDPREVGSGRRYETMVFRVSGEGRHGEGDVDDWGGVETRGYWEPEEAELGHIEACRDYAARAALTSREART